MIRVYEAVSMRTPEEARAAIRAGYYFNPMYRENAMSEKKPCDHPYATLVVKSGTGEVVCTKCGSTVTGLNRAVKATLPKDDGTPGDRPTLAPPTTTPNNIVPEV